MKRTLAIAAVVAILLLIAALIVPLWTKTAAISLDPFAFKMIVLMVIGCFVVGGGLMFLVFYSARKGYDDRVHHGGGHGPDRKP
jgi:heme/copper-type cytochrome/quinol oxidase subunit 2